LSGDTSGITLLTRLRLAAETFSPGFLLVVLVQRLANWRKLTVKLAIRISERTSLQLIIR